jgi:hypothetical protein
VLVLAVLGRGDRDQFDLCELMLPDHATGIAPGRPRLGAKTRRQRGQAHREFFVVDDGFSDEVCEGDFGGGDEPKCKFRINFRNSLFKFFFGRSVAVPLFQFLHWQAIATELIFKQLDILLLYRFNFLLAEFNQASIYDRFRNLKLILFKLGQLPRAKHHFVPHQQRRIDFAITMLIGMQIEHELSDRALQSCEALLQHYEAGARQFGRRLKIHKT